jgi:malonyl-CoA decarboxylase
LNKHVERRLETFVKRPKSTNDPVAVSGFLTDLIDTLTEQSRALLGRGRAQWAALSGSEGDLTSLGELLLSRRGEASGVAMAEALLAAYGAASPDEKLAFLEDLCERFGPERSRIEDAVGQFVKVGADDQTIDALRDAIEPRRQELLRRLNLAPGGTAALVRLREDLLAQLHNRPRLKTADADFVHLFSSWFNRGFLVLKPIDWTTPANILEKIIRYEAVHEIRNWDELRSRLEPPDRRCYGFFHPQLVDEPLVFVEIALTREIPDSVGPLLDLDRTPIAAAEATTAVFYSISNTQAGLSGVSFGNFLIKQVVEDLKIELPGLKTFVTLSPAPGFAAWLEQVRESDPSPVFEADAKKALLVLDEPDWHLDEGKVELVRPILLAAAAFYFLKAKRPTGFPLDPVARFHLGNGARLDRLNFLGDISENGLRQSHGLMVNYLYVLDKIEPNHEAYAEKGTVTVSSAVRKSLRGAPARAS